MCTVFGEIILSAKDKGKYTKEALFLQVEFAKKSPCSAFAY